MFETLDARIRANCCNQDGEVLEIALKFAKGRCMNGRSEHANLNPNPEKLLPWSPNRGDCSRSSLEEKKVP